MDRSNAAKLRISVHVVGMLREDCYLVDNIDTKEAVLIDPGDESRGLIRTLRDIKATPVAILITHAHFDHVGAVAGLLREYHGLKVYACIDEIPVFKLTNGLRSMAKRTLNLGDISFLKDGEEINLLGLSFRLIHTPGHSIGSACWYVPGIKTLFSGDTLFMGDCGRTDLETGDFKAIVDSIKRVLMALPDDTRVYPGHGPDTTIGYEREHNFVMTSIP